MVEPVIPIIDDGSLRLIGSIDFVPLKSNERHEAVDTLYAIIKEQSPRLFEAASHAMFGAGPSQAGAVQKRLRE